MARGRKRIRERVQVVESKRDLSREAEILNSQVRLDGVGEDPVIKALLLELPTASEVEAKEIALALQKRVRGEASLLENQEDLGHIINEIRAEAATIDKAAEEWEAGPEVFVDDIIGQAPKMTDQQRDQLRAKGMDSFKRAVANTRAGKSARQMQFKAKLKNSPLETINVTGKFFNTRNGPVHMPEEVRVMGISFRLEPGVHEVPSPIARVYRQMLADRHKLQQKLALMSGQGAPIDEGSYHHDDLMRRLADIEG
ncbi:MAG: hypothetical protein ACW99U_20305 [Candidatus Thorarchaeota archaeon]|jgi:hypothetical protein